MPFGAELLAEGVRFRLWAPDCRSVSLCLEGPDAVSETPLQRSETGWYETVAAGAGAGTRYRFRIDGDLRVPDPASRFQPDDIHGASEVIDPAAYRWRQDAWRGRPWEETILYELHVGTFSPEGTYRGVMDRLDYLVDLGVTAIELMPLADFPGRRDWGYNGAYPYAPDASHGRPEDLKALIDAAHERGLMVFLDVVYNHFGPEGNYLHAYAKRFFDSEKHTPWGAAISFDKPDSAAVRDFYIHNALYWIGEYRLDGLRFDAVHAIEDSSETHILEEIADAVHESFGSDRHVHLVLENDNKSRYLARAADNTPLLYVGQWNDDFHNALHVTLTGESSGYYVDYIDDPVAHLGRCLAEGFTFQGAPIAYLDGEPRGEPSGHLPPLAFVNFLQNHDQTGNRALGDRITTLCSPEAVRAATAITLLSPSPPMLFMGQEWASEQPFLFFCDLGDELTDSVRDGRRREFASFPEFSDPEARLRIPDPTVEATFLQSALDWRNNSSGVHAEALAFHRDLIALRKMEIVPRLAGTPGHAGTAGTWGKRGLTAAWTLGDGSRLEMVANMGPEASEPPALPGGRLLYATDGSDRQALERSLAPWTVAFFMEGAGA
jgi:malto-oligosyltrehalose trehalohydrolase